MVKPPVSVVIPCHNYERFLSDAVLSARYQTLNEIEIVVVDDGSTDGSFQRAKELGARTLRQENRGVAAARNLGVHATSGDWIAFLDADDFWEPHKLELQFAAVSEEKGVVLCHTNGVFVHGDGTETRRPRSLRPPVRGCPLAHLLPETKVFASAAIVQREALIRAGGFDVSLTYFDFDDLCFRLSAYGDFLFLEERLAYHRVHGANMTSDRSDLWAAATHVLRDHVLPKWEVFTTRFQPWERKKYYKLLRRLIAVCQSKHARSLAREGHWSAALRSHCAAIGSYPWLPSLYLRLLSTLIAGR